MYSIAGEVIESLKSFVSHYLVGFVMLPCFRAFSCLFGRLGIGYAVVIGDLRLMD